MERCVGFTIGLPIHITPKEKSIVSSESAEDITDRKQAEETLSRQLALIEASDDGTCHAQH
jgi:hypothetical protein